MKKTLFFAVAALTFAACTNQTELLTEIPPEEVAIKPVTQKSSRAAITTDTLHYQTKMYVFATQKNNTTYEKWFEDALFINTSGKGNNAWTGDGGGFSYGPKFNDFEFWAYTCDLGDDYVKPSTSFAIDDTNKRIKSLTLDFTNNNALTGSNDILVSGIATASKGTSGSTGAISLQFRHVLSWIKVNFLFSGSSTSDNIKINNVCLNKANFSGKLTVSPEYDSSTGAIVKYDDIWTDEVSTPSEEFPAYSTTDPDGISFTDASTRAAVGLLVVPGPQTSITFDYKTRSGSGFGDWQTFSVPLSTSENWESGKVYIYNISITTDEVTVVARVDAWNTENNINVPL